MQLYIEEVESELQALLPPTGALWNLALRLANTEVRSPADSISLASLEPRLLHPPASCIFPASPGTRLARRTGSKSDPQGV